VIVPLLLISLQNAHFTINSDAVKHGEELHCSHSACRASGIKFCFCAYCAIPVAKRNFRIRHHHCEETPLPTAGSDVYERLVREEAQATPTAPPASWEINDGNNQVEPPVRNSFPPSPGDSSHNRAFLAPRRMDSSGNTDNFPTVQSQSGQVKFGGQNGQETTPTAAVPCRARRGMPPDHNSDVRPSNESDNSMQFVHKVLTLSFPFSTLVIYYRLLFSLFPRIRAMVKI
jgi:hypothetical protein